MDQQTKEYLNEACILLENALHRPLNDKSYISEAYTYLTRALSRESGNNPQFTLNQPLTELSRRIGAVETIHNCFKGHLNQLTARVGHLETEAELHYAKRKRGAK